MSDAKELTNQYRLERWAMIIQECVNSGKPAMQWCSENNISRDKYYYWLRKVKLATGEGHRSKAPVLDAPKIVPLLPEAVVPMAVSSDDLSDQASIIIRSNGLVLEIKNHATEAAIGRMLKALKHL